MAPFHRSDGSDASVNMMYVHATYRYGTGAGWTAVEVPYANESTTLLAVLPDVGTLDAFETSLDAPRLAAIVSSLHPTDLFLNMPRFTMHTSTDLVAPLGALGMVQAFDDRADFSGIDGARDLVLTHVVHQTWVDVSESGTQAAAATGVSGEELNIIVTPPTITLDRPFVVFVRDNPTGAILFEGRVADPTSGG
jgi:serpin B